MLESLPIHVQDLLALDREQSRENTFRQTSAEDNEIVLLIHVEAVALGEVEGESCRLEGALAWEAVALRNPC